MPALLKHVKELDKAGIIIVEWKAGWRLEKPDARKTFYRIHGKDRVEKVLELLENDVAKRLSAGKLVQRIIGLTMEVQSSGPKLNRVVRAQLEKLLSEFEDDKLSLYLAEDEKQKVGLARLVCDYFRKE